MRALKKRLLFVRTVFLRTVARFSGFFCPCAICVRVASPLANVVLLPNRNPVWGFICQRVFLRGADDKTDATAAGKTDKTTHTQREYDVFLPGASN